MASKEHLLDPSILSAVDNYSLVARTIVEGFVSGLHRSLYHGLGSEFVHYRNYTPGDDLKYLDWKVFGRSDKYQIKVFQEETNTNCYVVLDTSASMAYSGSPDRISKLEYGKILAACLTYLVSKQGDNVGFFGYSDRLHSCVKPSHRTGHVQTICNQLTRLQPGGASDHVSVLRRLAELFQRRGLIVLISDFLDVDDAFLSTIRFFRFSHHDCVVFHILDDAEVDFPFSADTRFVDSESGQEITTAPDHVREQYQSQLDGYLRRFATFCQKNNIDYNRIQNSQPLTSALASYLHRRERFK